MFISKSNLVLLTLPSSSISSCLDGVGLESILNSTIPEACHDIVIVLFSSDVWGRIFSIDNSDRCIVINIIAIGSYFNTTKTCRKSCSEIDCRKTLNVHYRCVQIEHDSRCVAEFYFTKRRSISKFKFVGSVVVGCVCSLVQCCLVKIDHEMSVAALHVKL